MTRRHSCIIDVHVIARRGDGRILLGRRVNTGYSDGMLHLPSGHLEAGEPVTAAAVREAAEETGVIIDSADLRFAHVMHHSPDRIGFFFLADRWEGEPRNREPDRCAELVWADPDDLPQDVVAYAAAGIRASLAARPYSLYGWPDPDPESDGVALGLRDGIVAIAEHDQSWQRAAARYGDAVAAALGTYASAVEHVGSTAVAGLAARPVIDLAVRLTPGVQAGEVIDRMAAAGYLFHGDQGREGGLLFVAEKQAAVRAAQVHALAHDDTQFDRYLAIRDRLRADPTLADRYSQLKHDLAARHPDDDATYTAAKRTFLIDLAPDTVAEVTAPPVQRVRAALITPGGRLLATRRSKPGQPVHWVLPGGGIEPADGSLEDAAIREVVEETGGRPDLHRLIHVAHVAGTSHAVFLARIATWDEQLRTGPEFVNPHGGYHLDELPLDPDTLADGTVWPTPTLHMLAETLRAGTDLFDLPDLRDHGPLVWQSRHQPQPWTGPLAMVTSSPAKFAIAADHAGGYGIKLEQVDQQMTEIQSVSVEEVARHKAQQAYQRLGQPVIVEDSAFGLDELGGYPGAMVKHLIDAGGAAAVAHLADLTTTRACTSHAALAYADAHGCVTFTHTRTGAVADRPQGATEGLPLWTVYIPPGHHHPLAALPDNERDLWRRQWQQNSVFAQFARWYTQHHHNAPPQPHTRG